MSDAELLEKAQLLFRNLINPGLALHGGKAEVKRVEDKVIYITFSGGCQGCVAVKMTLEIGILSAVNEYLPEVMDVIDETNHEEGNNPFLKE